MHRPLPSCEEWGVVKTTTTTKPCVVIFLVVRSCEDNIKKKTKKTMMRVCSLPGFEEVWAHEQEEYQEDNDVSIIVFLVVKSCEHSSNKKHIKPWIWWCVHCCLLDCEKLWGVVNITTTRRPWRWQHTCHHLLGCDELWT